ncbi:uncharacterized protein LOC116776809 [Danaus plexippus]|uniref:uncharacterized protein LOC116776809 n=1 Tax=Danaus plexippus TaxID=13037 RepID=UPI002AB1E4EE|nr:uncharacterized protein LOC116776809 [Danaus plexippus]
MTVKMEKEYDCNFYTSLKTRSKQACEFCDQEFTDGYSYLVHNASHIIIPLIRQTLYCCDTCKFYFTTTNDFTEHTNRHVGIKDEKNIELDLAKVKLEKSPELVEPLELKQESLDIDMDSLCSSHHYIEEAFCVDVRTEDKIKFEDDFDSESLKKFTHVKAELYSECCYGGDGMYGDRQQPANGGGCEEPAAVCGVDDSVLTSVLTSDECRSVHYSELKSTGLSICRLCGLKLPDRFRLVLHETKHLRLVKRRNTFLVCVYCDRYIAGNYRNMDRHLTREHTSRPRKKHILHKCKECHLPYTKYRRHVMNYHQRERCSWERLEEGSVERRGGCGVGASGDNVKASGVCCRDGNSHDACALTGTREGGGVKHKTSRRQKKMKKKKSLTNVERLRNIQQRLRKINKLSKYCDDFYYIDRRLK